jgi:hypothetical protein
MFMFQRRGINKRDPGDKNVGGKRPREGNNWRRVDRTKGEGKKKGKTIKKRAVRPLPKISPLST